MFIFLNHQRSVRQPLIEVTLILNDMINVCIPNTSSIWGQYICFQCVWLRTNLTETEWRLWTTRDWRLFIKKNYKTFIATFFLEFYPLHSFFFAVLKVNLAFFIITEMFVNFWFTFLFWNRVIFVSSWLQMALCFLSGYRMTLIPK